MAFDIRVWRGRLHRYSTVVHGPTIRKGRPGLANKEQIPDERLLSSEELAEYRRIKSSWETYRGGAKWGLISAACAFGLFLGWLSSQAFKSGDEAGSNTFGAIGMTLFLGAIPYGLLLNLIADIRRGRTNRANAEEYLRSIDYGRRTLPEPKRTVDDSDGSYSPHWHVRGYDHSRHAGMFSSSDRSTMNEYGMDADTYISNVLENDRD
jgi:hypothetical protein